LPLEHEYPELVALNDGPPGSTPYSVNRTGIAFRKTEIASNNTSSRRNNKAVSLLPDGREVIENVVLAGWITVEIPGFTVLSVAVSEVSICGEPAGKRPVPFLNCPGNMNLGMDKLKSAAVTDSRYKARVDCSGALPRKGCKREFVNGSSRIPVGEHRIRASIHATNPDGLFGWASLNHLEYVGTPIGR